MFVWDCTFFSVHSIQYGDPDTDSCVTGSNNTIFISPVLRFFFYIKCISFGISNAYLSIFLNFLCTFTEWLKLDSGKVGKEMYSKFERFSRRFWRLSRFSINIFNKDESHFFFFFFDNVLVALFFAQFLFMKMNIFWFLGHISIAYLITFYSAHT